MCVGIVPYDSPVLRASSDERYPSFSDMKTPFHALTLSARHLNNPMTLVIRHSPYQHHDEGWADSSGTNLNFSYRFGASRWAHCYFLYEHKVILARQRNKHHPRQHFTTFYPLTASFQQIALQELIMTNLNSNPSFKLSQNPIPTPHPTKIARNRAKSSSIPFAARFCRSRECRSVSTVWRI